MHGECHPLRALQLIAILRLGNSTPPNLEHLSKLLISVTSIMASKLLILWSKELA
jgi:hypothetical protein